MKILVTGANSGFGHLIARTQIQNGDTVFATMRDVKGRNAAVADELHKFAADAPGEVHVIELDVTNDASVNDALGEAGALDVLVNNAGIGAAGFTEAFPVDQWQKVLDVNVLGVQRVTRAALPAMRKAGSGLVLFVSSVMGRMVIPFAGPYTASKWALEGMAESYRYELARCGVDVSIVEPGGFNTGIGDRLTIPADEACVESYGEVGQIANMLWAGFGEMLGADDSPDPQIVADEVAKLIATPPGQRPLRLVVDPLMSDELPTELNDTAARVQGELLHTFGLASLRSVPST